MQWLVGADLGVRSGGAMQAATWLARPAHAQTCDVVHVFEPALRPLLRKVMTEESVAATRRELVASIAGLGLPQPFRYIDVVVADSPEAGLAHHAVTGGHDVLLLGRIAPQSTDALLRLGPVARRLLRRLPVAVAIVPPDLTADAIGAGHIVLGTDLTATSVAAGRFAYQLANELGRGLVVMQVDDSRSQSPVFGPDGEVELPSPSRPAHANEGVARWVESQGLRSASPRRGEGPVVDALLACAREEDSPVVVVGSRMLSLAQRVFKASVGTDLARLANRMVVVVPS